MIRKAIEIERAKRIEKFKGEGLVLESALASSKQQDEFLYFRILPVYKEFDFINLFGGVNKILFEDIF
ncbi:hypothetical protein [Enterococcus mundtii]|uniref:hypothetical protein n=1 Tax=Enterococcus mundtii TaxID=53346 RepID=UPI000A343C8A|nr:hypothetical protein [Enterococcus mundtii]